MDSTQKFWTIGSFNPSCTPISIVAAYTGVLPYVKDFLCAPHPFREGAVCPFVPAALKNDRIFFAACSEDDTSLGHANHIEHCIKFYLSSKAHNKNFGALIILFPREYDVGKLLELHLQNKEQCVRHSLMLGALYCTSQAPSLHNEGYFPLRTPTPVLVIRDMVASDLMFLDPKHYNLEKRLVFLGAFIETFQNQKGIVAQKEVQKALTLSRHYKKKQHFRRNMSVCVLILTLLFFLTIVFLMR